jgi:hypothetical protein
VLQYQHVIPFCAAISARNPILCCIHSFHPCFLPYNPICTALHRHEICKLGNCTENIGSYYSVTNTSSKTKCYCLAFPRYTKIIPCRWIYTHIHVSLQIDKNAGVLHVKTIIGLWSYFVHFFLEREIFQTKFVAKIKTHIFVQCLFFSKIIYTYKYIYIYKYTSQCTRTTINIFNELEIIKKFLLRERILICGSYSGGNGNYGLLRCDAA